MEKKYYIGLDMGTDSIGWAVTDEDYNILKARKRKLWGSYLFNAAQTAQERRGYRTARRRLARVHHRLMLLQELFAEEIYKVDPTFFIRLNDSKLKIEDKDERIKTQYVLFNDAHYTDKDFFAQYPTIFHLRAAAIKGEVKDIRMLYLCIHHILKNRGHFLFEGQNFDVNDTQSIKNKFSEMNAFLSKYEYSVLSLEKIDEALLVLRDNIVKSKKQTKLYEIFYVKKNKQLKALINAMCGCKVDLKDLYSAEEKYDEIESFSFEKEDFENSVLPQIESAVGFEEAALVRLLKAIYDWSMLSNILNGHSFLSDSKVESYEEHKKDLLQLKEYIRKHCPEKYNLVFRHVKGKEKIANYAAYIGMDKQHGYGKCTKGDFYTFLKKNIKVEDENILLKIEKGTFMPKQISNANGTIPYQVHLQELKAILVHAEQRFPFLKNIENGWTISDKICSLLTFRIPYYVGPLQTNGSAFAWLTKKPNMEKVRITPWNFDDIVDKEKSEQDFIARMTNKCTYLPKFDVLPASSLLYSEYVFLNELNNLKVKNEKNKQVKQLILDYAKEHKKVKIKNCFSLLISQGLLEKNERIEAVFSGLDGDFTTSLSSYNDFRKIIGNKVDTNTEMCEEIIKWITIISDKTRLEKLIKRNMGTFYLLKR